MHREGECVQCSRNISSEFYPEAEIRIEGSEITLKGIQLHQKDSRRTKFDLVDFRRDVCESLIEFLNTKMDIYKLLVDKLDIFIALDLSADVKAVYELI